MVGKGAVYCTLFIGVRRLDETAFKYDNHHNTKGHPHSLVNRPAKKNKKTAALLPIFFYSLLSYGPSCPSWPSLFLLSHQFIFASACFIAIGK